jgi:hypothetical protein
VTSNLSDQGANPMLFVTKGTNVLMLADGEIVPLDVEIGEAALLALSR